MKKYFELRDQRFNWHPAILLNDDNNTQTFELISNNEEVRLKKEEFHKREMSVNQIHLERLGFENQTKEITEKSGLFLIPLYNINGELHSLNLEFFGYILFPSSDKEKVKKKFSEIFEDYKNKTITKKEVEAKFDSFYSINDLFDELSKHKDFKFTELDIVSGK